MKLELCDDLYLQDVLVFQILGRDVDARRSGTVQFLEHLFFLHSLCGLELKYARHQKLYSIEVSSATVCWLSIFNSNSFRNKFLLTAPLFL